MRQRKQNYITLSCDGEVVPQRGAAAPAPESADVAYRLSRMVEEAAAALPLAPNVSRRPTRPSTRRSPRARPRPARGRASRPMRRPAPPRRPPSPWRS